MSASKKKYTLFANAEPGNRSACAFFASAAGCRNGDKCKFSHEVLSSKGKGESSPHRPTADTSSVVSSEMSIDGNDAGGNDNIFVKMADVKKEKIAEAQKKEKVAEVKKESADGEKKLNQNQRKAAKRSIDSDPFANPKGKIAKTSAEPAKQAPPKKESSPPPPAKKSATKKPKTETPATAGFWAMDLPVASFSCMPGDDKTSKPEATPTKTPDTAPIVKKEEEAPKFPLPKSNPLGRKWLSAIKQTTQHTRFEGAYDFEKYQQQDESNGMSASSWIKAKPYGDWCAKNPQVIAMDCEMCETADPVSGLKDSRALCRISVVDVKTNEVLLDTLVKPAWPVSDYRTWVNGIGAEHLENVQFTLRHAQAFMMKLCSDETVMMGHALQNDLAAIRMSHHACVDSAFLFPVKDSPNSSISLKDLTKSVLKTDMPKTHDSVNDSRMSMECLKIWLEKDGKVEPIVRPSSPSYACQLFVHRIPKVCEASHLSRMFLHHTTIEPVEVEPIEFAGSDIGKTHIIFKSGRHASLAFDSLEGKGEPDTSGKLQKKVFLKSGGYVRIRKMVHENHGESLSPLKRSETK